jgi:tetratricopeptide (TPR) repeat protein
MSFEEYRKAMAAQNSQYNPSDPHNLQAAKQQPGYINQSALRNNALAEQLGMVQREPFNFNTLVQDQVHSALACNTDPFKAALGRAVLRELNLRADEIGRLCKELGNAQAAIDSYKSTIEELRSDREKWRSEAYSHAKLAERERSNLCALNAIIIGNATVDMDQIVPACAQMLSVAKHADAIRIHDRAVAYLEEQKKQSGDLQCDA